MNVNPLLMSLKQTMDVPVYPDFCTDCTLDRYIAFNYVSEKADRYADNEPVSETTEVHVHYFMRGYNVQNEKRRLRKELYKLGFKGWVAAEMYEEDTKLNHVVIVCKISGVPDYI